MLLECKIAISRSYAKPKLMAEKFAALDRPKSNNSTKPRKRKAGPRALARDGLAAVYSSAGITNVTTPEELPEGEQRMLREGDLSEFVDELYTPTTARKTGVNKALD